MNAEELDLYLRRPRMKETMEAAPEPQMVEIRLLNDRTPPVSAAFAVELHDRFRAVGRHGHDFLECMYVYTGTVTHQIEGQRIPLQQDDFLFLPPGVFHSVEVCGEDDLAVNFIIRPELLLDELPGLLNTLPEALLACLESRSRTELQVHGAKNPAVRLLCTHILCEALDPDARTADTLRLQAGLLFHELARCMEAPLTRRTGSASEQLDYVLRYIESNAATVTLESAARRFGYAPGYLSAMLKAATGKNFTGLRGAQRMQQAVTLLRTTDLSVRQISAEVGISNVTYFYRQFQAIFQMSPAEYRKSLRSEGQTEQNL